MDICKPPATPDKCILLKKHHTRITAHVLWVRLQYSFIKDILTMLFVLAQIAIMSAQHFWNFTEVINLIIINWPKFWDVSQQAPTSYRLFTKNIKYVYGLYMYTKNIKYIYNTGVFNKCRYILTKILKRLINYIRKPSLIITLSVSKKGLWQTDRQTRRRTLL